MLLQERCAYQGIYKLDLDIKKERTEKNISFVALAKEEEEAKQGSMMFTALRQPILRASRGRRCTCCNAGVLLSAVAPERQLPLRYGLAAAGAVGHAGDGAARPER